jgi:putative acetyltransferase
MITTLRTDSTHPDFVALVKLLDVDLAIRDGVDHTFYAQFNKIDKIKYAIVAFDDGHAVACGAIKEFDPSTAEVKRMYTLPLMRGQGVAALVLSALEGWAKELGYSRCILETGYKQPEALALYKKSGYSVTPNYGQYVGVANSVCFAKSLTISR